MAIVASLKIIAVMLLLIAAGCDSDSQTSGDLEACFEIQSEFPIELSRDLDILFVVDTSPSMSDEAERAAINAARFANVLSNIEGGLPNLHIAVVSSDVAARGGLLEAPAQASGCEPPQGAFLSDIVYANGEREANYSGSLADALTCMLRVPPTGGLIEEPLEAVKRALDGSNPGNQGFLRENFLFVVFLTDEDDCSGGLELADGLTGTAEGVSAWRCFDDAVTCDESTAELGARSGCRSVDTPRVLEPVAGYAEFLRGLKEDPGQVLVSAVLASGVPVVASSADGLTLSSVCAGDLGDAGGARPATRLLDFIARFPQRGSFTDVCGDDWSDVMIPIAETLRKTLGYPCLQRDADLDPDTEGIQHECQVSELRYPGTDGQEERGLPECSTSDPSELDRPCWRIFDDPICQGLGQGFEVLRGRESVVAGTIRARCFGGCYRPGGGPSD